MLRTLELREANIVVTIGQADTIELSTAHDDQARVYLRVLQGDRTDGIILYRGLKVKAEQFYEALCRLLTDPSQKNPVSLAFIDRLIGA